MTAILAYSNIKGENSIALMAADNKVLIPNNSANSSRLGDKLTKIFNRFTIGICGLDAVDSMITHCFTYPDMWSNLRPSIDSIADLAQAFNKYLPIFLAKTKPYYIKAYKSLITMDTHLIVLDCVSNKLYFANIGKLFDDSKVLSVVFNVLPPNKLFLFGAPVIDRVVGYDSEDLDEMRKDVLKNHFIYKLKSLQIMHPGVLGEIGSFQLNILGSNPESYLKSAYNSIEDFIHNLVLPS